MAGTFARKGNGSRSIKLHDFHTSSLHLIEYGKACGPNDIQNARRTHLDQLEEPRFEKRAVLHALSYDGNFNRKIFGLWDKLPAFRNNMNKIPTVHIPMKKEAVREALSSRYYMIQTKIGPGRYRL